MKRNSLAGFSFRICLCNNNQYCSVCLDPPPFCPCRSAARTPFSTPDDSFFLKSYHHPNRFRRVKRLSKKRHLHRFHNRNLHLCLYPQMIQEPALNHSALPQPTLTMTTGFNQAPLTGLSDFYSPEVLDRKPQLSYQAPPPLYPLSSQADEHQRLCPYPF